MSYARFGWGGSDVYVFSNVGGFLDCCGCRLTKEPVKYLSTADMIAHLHEHRAVGHTVPDDCFEGLKADQEENDKFIQWTLKTGMTRRFSKPYGKYHRYEDIDCFRCKGTGHETRPATKPFFIDGKELLPAREAYDGPCKLCDGTGKRTVGRDFEHFFTAVGWSGGKKVL